MLNSIIRASIKRLLAVPILDYSLDPYFNEILAREQFFASAFRLLAFNQISGDYAEFGCNGCNTFGIAYKYIAKYSLSSHMHAFDSFQGLPKPQHLYDNHPQWIEGEMTTTLEKFRKLCRYRAIPTSKYSTYPGYYQESLNERLWPSLPRDISLAYIDCDLYTSTVPVLSYLSQILKNGMILAFDDYFCCSDTQQPGEMRAFNEFKMHNQSFHFLPYLTFGWSGMSYIVQSAP